MRGLQRRIVVEGLNLERFLCTAAEQGIGLSAVKRINGRKLTAVAEESSLPVLEELTSTAGWRMSAGEPVGLSCMINAVKRRWSMLAAVLIFLLNVWLATQMMWSISIVDAEAYEPDIRAALDEMGVTPPMLRHHVDTGAIRDSLEWRYPHVAWVECGWRGMTLEIRLVEGVAASERNSGGPCDVIAARDGIVKSIVTRAGTAVVKPGEVVRKGQVLIRGEERSSEGLVQPVAARGSVYARIWDLAEVKTSLSEVETNYTGRTQNVFFLKCPWFSLWHTEDAAFPEYDTAVWEMPLGGLFLPLVMRWETRIEADYRSVERDLQSVIDEGERAAKQVLYENLGGRETIVDIWMNWSIIEDEILLSVATAERVVDIAQQERSSGMAATE